MSWDDGNSVKSSLVARRVFFFSFIPLLLIGIAGLQECGFDVSRAMD
jgi:hypothetical protein